MPYLILAYDITEGMEVKREQVRDAHRTYLGAQGRKLLASGALLAVNGRTVIGGASLFDTDEYKEAARSRPKTLTQKQVFARALKSWNGA